MKKYLYNFFLIFCENIYLGNSVKLYYYIVLYK